MSTKKFLLITVFLLALLLAGCNLNAPPQADTGVSQPVAAQPVATAVPVAQADTAQDAAQPSPIPTQAEPQDTTPPTIAVPGQQQRVAFYLTDECGFTSFEVDFQVNDDTGLEDLRVEYRLRTFDGEAETVATAPTYAGMGSYQFVMPVSEVANDALQGYGGVLEYSLVALDGAGNQARYPEGDAWVQVVVLPCTEEVAAAVAEVTANADAPQDENVSTSGQAGGASQPATGNSAAPWIAGTAVICPPNCPGGNVGQSGSVVPGARTPPSQGIVPPQSGNSGGTGSTGGTTGNNGPNTVASPSVDYVLCRLGDANACARLQNYCANVPSDPLCSSSNGQNASGNNGSSGSGSSGGATIDPCVANPSDPSCTPTVNTGGTDSGMGVIENTGNSGGSSGGSSSNGSSGDATIDPCVANPSDPSCTPTVDTGGTNSGTGVIENIGNSGGSSSGGASGGATIDPCVANPSDPSCAPSVNTGGGDSGTVILNP